MANAHMPERIQDALIGQNAIGGDQIIEQVGGNIDRAYFHDVLAAESPTPSCASVRIHAGRTRKSGRGKVSMPQGSVKRSPYCTPQPDRAAQTQSRSFDLALRCC